MQKALDPNVRMLITLDKSQSGSQTEKKLLAADQQKNLSAFNTHFVIGQSATHQISHTKGFVADGKVAAEGSTNWSVSGEGEFVIYGSAGGTGYKAQNNTQSVITDPDTVARFTAELIAEHMAAHRRRKPLRRRKHRLAVHDPTKVSSLKSPPEGTAPPAKTAPAQKTPAKSEGKS